ncbi:hypothetical protein BGW36DRAFT_404218 [Talaromyces proteolyticus]|uniref:Uncharacterized protein n=1 Tax=Talaromyces proteolyticus TaxID=1131652 RepID=A0AAD4L1R9_9EURO|nr:uncharacterized protein BGW36DRAFT_404218 [Talaromyces proteolyticus]KAH8703950.1 hypothetical protein BGW36DRAFT_404218 [Talaromyces proteolyticus]
MATTMDISSNPLAKFSLRTRQNTILHTGYMGTIKYMLQTLIFEEYSTGLHAQIGVFEGQRVDVNTNEEVDCIIKVRMQLNPVLIPHASSSSRASYFLDRECRALRAAQYSGRTPDFVACASEVQDRSGFYPGGYLDIIAMSKLPGKPIAQCLGALTAADLKVIKKDLAVLLK